MYILKTHKTERKTVYIYVYSDIYVYTYVNCDIYTHTSMNKLGYDTM